MADNQITGLARMRNLWSAPESAGTRPEPAANPAALSSSIVAELLHEFEAAGHGWFWATDAEGRLSYISDAIAKDLNAEGAGALIGTPITNIFSVDSSASGRNLPLLLSGQKRISDLLIQSSVSGDQRRWNLSGRPRRDEAGQFIGYLGHGNTLSEAETRALAEDSKSGLDSLTGLANRDRITERLEKTLANFSVAKRSCAVMMMDLDKFKQVNDTLGHPAGDELLRQVADRLRRVCGQKCEIGRLGGDEFQIFVPDVDDRGDLGDRAARIIAMLSQPFSLEAGRCVIGASVGIAIAPYDGIEREAVVRSADLALYAAKNGGRGQFRFYSADLLAEADRRKQIKAELGLAIERDQMRLVYQPRVDERNTVVALRASLGWEHPEFEDIAPSTFMPMAEETRLIIPMVEWAVRRACQDARQWPGKVRVAIEVPIELFVDRNFPALVTQALAEADLPADRLEIEVSESIYTADYSAIARHLQALKMLGVRLVLDGFGTGYASLSSLRGAPFDSITISDCFVRHIAGETDGNEAFVTTIVSLAEAMKMSTIALGAESMEELAIVRRLGVGLVQGGLFAPPLPAEEVLQAMESGSWTLQPDGPRRYRAERRSVLRNIGLIHEDFRYEVRLRNLSRTGCLIEGLVDVPVDTQFVVDFGGGQLAVARVIRSAGAQQGLEFELPMVDDGAGGLVTRNRVSPYALAAAGMPLNALPPGNYPLSQIPGSGEAFSMPKFAQAQLA